MLQTGTEQRPYYGNLDVEELARALVLHFDAGETQARWMRGEQGRAVVQVQTRRVRSGDPTNSVSAHLTPLQGGVRVALQEQQTLAVAADLAKTGVRALLNPLSLVGQIDSIARNVRRLNLRQEVWQAVESYVRSAGSGSDVASQLQAVVCPYCGTPNELGSLTCHACRAPLTEAQPIICARCGYRNDARRSHCGNCNQALL